ncbi:hypothetical protein EDB81DRAFT_640287 [Dactylonectria macrodidyma]|uniref:Zn(2)-C6 fungal-type domain-containing protein n=1 Tax=Dactylonectria macrodidyma TaxID=307937 RepID=A0A9P9JKS2_9HYPO|nr:hypothetical protein EDB81DRAFT_640287 [Dactylonectria macrodidyma]
MSRAQGRKRSRLACKTCRDLKRKCDGDQPCGTCVRFEYDCVYQGPRGSKRKATEDLTRDQDVAEGSPHTAPSILPSPTVLPPLRETAPPAATTRSQIRSLEANSGAAFLRKLALRLNPKDAPRLHTFAWNAFLGARRTGLVPVSRSITDMLSETEMHTLAAVYFDKIDPTYGFINRQEIDVQIGRRWTLQLATDMEEAMLCGIAALGCLYSNVQTTPTELDLLETARLILEQKISEIPSAATVTAWILRVVYLRIAETHHMAWMASCILMHMVEAAGLHCEPSTESVLPSAQEEVDSEIRRRLVAISQHLNIWLSFDMGRSRVTLCNATVIMPSERPGDYTAELMELLPYSAMLDPEKAPDASELETTLTAVLNRVHSVPTSVLGQVNLALCLCRRLQAMNETFAGPVLEQILALTSKGIESAQSILDARAPWHHMANVPFQIVCLLLAVDNNASLSRLNDAMQCLSNIAEVYNTEATQEALKTASLLILLHKRWKEKCASALGEILELFPAVQPQEADNAQPCEQPDNIMWLNSLAGDLSTLPYFDVNQLFVPDIFKDNDTILYN